MASESGVRSCHQIPNWLLDSITVVIYLAFLMEVKMVFCLWKTQKIVQKLAFL